MKTISSKAKAFNPNLIFTLVLLGIAALIAISLIPSLRVASAQGSRPGTSLQGLSGSREKYDAALKQAQLQAPASSWVAAAAYPIPIVRYAFAKVGEELYVISGVSNGSVVPDVRKYNATTNVWTSLANIPGGTEAPAGAVFGGKIYVASGNGSNTFYIYDIGTNMWTTGPSRIGVSDSYGAAAAAFNGNVYVVGGGSAGPSTTLSIYNIAGNSWSAGPAAPSPYLLGGYTQVGSFLYLVGSFGASSAANTNVTMRLDMSTNTWTTGPVWTQQRADFGLANAGTKIYALGGDANGGGFFDGTTQVDELDTSAWPAGSWVASPDNLPSARQANQAGFFSTGRVGGEIWSTGGLTPAFIFIADHIYRAQATGGGCTAGNWQVVAPMPTDFYGGAATSNGTYAYVAGGYSFSAGVSLNTFFRYDPAANTWTTLAPMPTVGTAMASAVYSSINNKVYVFGGEDAATGVNTNVTRIYDIASGTWSLGANMPDVRSFMASGYSNGKIYLISGYNTGQVTSAQPDVWEYDPLTNTFNTSRAPIPHATGGAGFGVINGHIYVAGGRDAANLVIDLTWDYNISANTWTARANMPGPLNVPGSGVASLVSDNRLWLFGGGNPFAPDTTAGSLVYDPSTDSWSTGPALNVGRSFVAGTAVSNKLVAAGGYNGSTTVNTTEVLELTCNVGAPSIAAAGSTLVNESCPPSNAAIDPGETVTLNLNLINNGSASTTNLVATLQPSANVLAPSGPMSYGAIAPGATVGRNFTFTANGNCGDTITLTLQLQDGSTNLGTVTYTKVLGATVVNTSFSENFDGVTAPALPAGWTTAATGVESPWVTSTTTPDTAPNDAFAPDPSNIGNTELVSPTIAIPAGGGVLAFRNNYNTESTFDGMVLEISINGGAYADIITAGGSFNSGGYNATISSSFGSPIAGRMAWSGNSAGYINTSVNLPAAAAGQNINLKWRMASDNSVAVVGVMIDTISITSTSISCNTACQGSPLITTTTTLSCSGANKVATITVKNGGTGIANNVVLTTAVLGGVNGTPLPQSIGTLAPGAQSVRTVTFSGAPSGMTTLQVAGTYTGGSFNTSKKVLSPTCP